MQQATGHRISFTRFSSFRPSICQTWYIYPRMKCNTPELCGTFKKCTLSCWISHVWFTWKDRWICWHCRPRRVVILEEPQSCFLPSLAHCLLTPPDKDPCLRSMSPISPHHFWPTNPVLRSAATQGPLTCILKPHDVPIILRSQYLWICFTFCVTYRPRFELG